MNVRGHTLRAVGKLLIETLIQKVLHVIDGTLTTIALKVVALIVHFNAHTHWLALPFCFAFSVCVCSVDCPHF